MATYLQELQEFPKLGIQSLAKDAFQISLLEMGSSWKRFIHDLDRFPFKLFSLLRCETSDDFVQECERIHKIIQTCKKCVDVEFTVPLLAYIARGKMLAEEGGDHGAAQLVDRVELVRDFLKDVATFVPLSSDQVECVHGQHQSQLHRFRGQKPSDAAASEACLWSTINSSYKKFWQLVWGESGDCRARSRLSRYGVKGSNQYTASEKHATRDAKSVNWRFRDLGQLCDQPQLAKSPKKLCGFLPAIQHIVDSCMLYDMMKSLGDTCVKQATINVTK